ncbi:proline-rich receptor-like protein kinase PERK2 [Iris pallida]|uniref:Proline-rich receptor-like protein kinase PERK2 n=1 Tax=Iris pallida TaxID=29817 RepID=A0AAX6EEW0_IRIPA|nr:proline-rich receptor-like protein kinase PERK2 [Iris pallida]KAJ6827384.1 proline-rich receptor-like protein kinase PERK2 [Iris pallida]
MRPPQRSPPASSPRPFSAPSPAHRRSGQAAPGPARTPTGFPSGDPPPVPRAILPALSRARRRTPAVQICGSPAVRAPPAGPALSGALLGEPEPICGRRAPV